MQFKFIETPGTNGHRCALHAVIEDDLEVKVESFGCGEYKVALRDLHNLEEGQMSATARVNEVAVNAGLVPVESGIYGSELWGIALVWAEPSTVCHLVWDMMRNY